MIPEYEYQINTIGFTVVGHDLSKNTKISNCKGVGCFSLRLNYSATINQMKVLTDISATCYQIIKVKSKSLYNIWSFMLVKAYN